MQPFLGDANIFLVSLKDVSIGAMPESISRATQAMHSKALFVSVAVSQRWLAGEVRAYREKTMTR